MVNFIYFLICLVLIKSTKEGIQTFWDNVQKHKQKIKTTPFIMAIHIKLNLLGEAMQMDIHYSSVSIKCKNNK